MKNLTFSFLLIFITFGGLSCAVNKATNKVKLLTKSERIILEIDSLSYDSLGSVNGRNLYFRLFDSGDYEYEEISEEKLKDLGIQSFASETIETKRDKISEQDLNEINLILKNSGLPKVNSEYKNAEGFCTCGASRLEIRYRDVSGYIKNINIDGSNCADLRNPDQKVFPKFPKTISNLLTKIHNIKYPET